MRCATILLALAASVAARRLEKREPVRTAEPTEPSPVNNPHPLERYPECSRVCMKRALDVQACAYMDVKCICSKRDMIRKLSMGCIFERCSVEQARTANRKTAHVCEELERQWAS